MRTEYSFNRFRYGFTCLELYGHVVGTIGLFGLSSEAIQHLN